MTVIPRICLNMIVKNESRIILRLLESVYKLIDTYCICDTGSTDDTINIIETFFQEQKIPGKVIQEPFRDFGYNRSFALKACESIDAEYILLLDADMIFWVNPEIPVEEIKLKLIDHTYYIFQGSDTYYYKNTRIVKNNMGFKYWGVTHEYVDNPKDKGPIITGQFTKDVLFIKDIGDGGAKTDKFLRDIRLLEKGLEDLPGNDRYLFYLANSYKDSRQLEKAIEVYKKRIDAGGWIEEIWYSHFCIGKCWKDLGDMERAIAAWMNGFQAFPNRIENLFEIMHHYRLEGKNQLSYWFFMIADRMRRDHPEREYLFMQKDIYDYKIDYELSILGYYVNIDKHDLAKVSMKVLSDKNVPDSTMTNVLSNYKFYTRKWIHSAICSTNYLPLFELLNRIGKKTLEKNPDLKSSTPSFCFIDKNTLVVNIRMVNYWINDKGGYENPGNIKTINVLALLRNDFEFKTEDGEAVDSDDEIVAPWESRSWKIVQERELEYDTSVDDYYIGIEDIRLSYDANTNTIFYNGNRALERGNMVVEHGKIDWTDFSTYEDVFLEMETQQKEIEKNWVLFPWKDSASNPDKIRMIYGWSPLKIGYIVPEKIDIHTESRESVKTFQILSEETTLPPFFKYIRGSTNGIYIPEYDETWFICHVVSYEDRRYYYHILVALDTETGKCKRYTELFTLEGQKVEYVLGFERLSPDFFLIGYSTMDKDTKYISISKKHIDSFFFASCV